MDPAQRFGLDRTSGRSNACKTLVRPLSPTSSVDEPQLDIAGRSQ
jgi:hypothetical protein